MNHLLFIFPMESSVSTASPNKTQNYGKFGPSSCVYSPIIQRWYLQKIFKPGYIKTDLLNHGAWQQSSGNICTKRLSRRQALMSVTRHSALSAKATSWSKIKRKTSSQIRWFLVMFVIYMNITETYSLLIHEFFSMSHIINHQCLD